MARTLFIRLGDLDLDHPHNATADWVVTDDADTLLEAQEGLVSEMDWPESADRVIVSVPTFDVLMTKVSIPGGNRQKLLRAVPYAVEEQIVDDVDSLHFSLSEKTEGNMYGVVASDSERMAAWLELLANAGICPSMLVPDVLCLPDRRHRHLDHDKQ